MMGGAHNAVKICIVIPMKGHPGLAWETLDSVFEQDFCDPFGLVLVNDGCNFSASTRVQFLGYSKPDHILYQYVTQPNQGLSAARNTGIEVALQMFPNAKGIYLLDADNRIGPGTMAAMHDAIDTHPTGDWFYPNINMFGIPYQERTDVYLDLDEMLVRNYCDASSLVSTRLFRAGLRYDEEFRSGYEDWDFWLSAFRDGFSNAIHWPALDLRYRQRQQSMVVDARDKDAEIRLQIERKHAWAYYGFPDAAALNHGQAPALLVVDDGMCYYTHGTHLKSDGISLEMAASRFWAHLCGSERGTFPQRVVFADAQSLKALEHQKLDQWALWKMIYAAADITVSDQSLMSISSEILHDPNVRTQLAAEAPTHVNKPAVANFLDLLEQHAPPAQPNKSLWAVRPKHQRRFAQARKVFPVQNRYVGPMFTSRETRCQTCFFIDKTDLKPSNTRKIQQRIKDKWPDDLAIIWNASVESAHVDWASFAQSVAFIDECTDSASRRTAVVSNTDRTQIARALSWGSEQLVTLSGSPLLADIAALRGNNVQVCVVDAGNLRLTTDGALHQAAVDVLEFEHRIDLVLCVSEKARMLLAQHGFPTDKLRILS